jgi:hypothetical protein
MGRFWVGFCWWRAGENCAATERTVNRLYIVISVAFASVNCGETIRRWTKEYLRTKVKFVGCVREKKEQSQRDVQGRTKRQKVDWIFWQRFRIVWTWMERDMKVGFCHTWKATARQGRHEVAQTRRTGLRYGVTVPEPRNARLNSRLSSSPRYRTVPKYPSTHSPTCRWAVILGFAEQSMKLCITLVRTECSP